MAAGWVSACKPPLGERAPGRCQVAVGCGPTSGFRCPDAAAGTGNTDIIDGASGYWAGLLDECPGADAGASWLAGASCWIDECYAADDAVTIVQALADHPAPDARASAETIRTRSPLSVALALRAVRRARELPDVAAVLDQDRALARTTMADPADFVEGVRAKMVDRDDRPRWRHARLADVDEAEVAARFVG